MSLGYQRITLTRKICESLRAGGLPISRTSRRTAPITQAWRNRRNWYDPEQARRVSPQLDNEPRRG